MNDTLEGLGGLMGLGIVVLIGWGVLSLFGISFGVENEGTASYSDCRQTITIQDHSWQTYTKRFTCNYAKTQSGKMMSGECVHIDTAGTAFSASSACETAYVYQKAQDPVCKGNSKGGVWYPYLGYNDLCYTTPQASETYIDPTSLGTPPQADVPVGGAKTPSTGTLDGSQYPKGKCVTESGVQICDLSYQSTGQTGNMRTVKMQANEIICQDLTTGTNSNTQSDTSNINTDPQFCASDYGAIYIDPTIYVVKHYGTIQVVNGSYTVPGSYGQCIWTYAGGSADIPYIEMSNQIGPDSGEYSVRAFCQNGSNQLDIFSAH